MDALKILMIIVPLIVFLLFSILSYSMLNAVSELRNRFNDLNNTLTIVYKTVALLNRTGETSIFVEVPELNSNPASYEGKFVIAVGEIHGIVTVPEIRLPYNAVIASGNQSFGVLTSIRFKEGNKVVVKGIITKGFQEYLTVSGWEKSREVYYIVAVEIEEV